MKCQVQAPHHPLRSYSMETKLRLSSFDPASHPTFPSQKDGREWKGFKTSSTTAERQCCKVNRPNCWRLRSSRLQLFFSVAPSPTSTAGSNTFEAVWTLKAQVMREKDSTRISGPLLSCAKRARWTEMEWCGWRTESASPRKRCSRRGAGV